MGQRSTVLAPCLSKRSLTAGRPKEGCLCSCFSWYAALAILNAFSLPKGAPPLSSLEKDKDIDFDLLQDLMDVDIDPLDIDLEKDPLAAKVFKVWTSFSLSFPLLSFSIWGVMVKISHCSVVTILF